MVFHLPKSHKQFYKMYFITVHLNPCPGWKEGSIYPHLPFIKGVNTSQGVKYSSLSASGGSNGKEFAWAAGDQGLIPGPGKSPGEGNGNPFHYLHLENSMDSRLWWAIVHRITKSWIWLSATNTISFSGYEWIQVCRPELLDILFLHQSNPKGKVAWLK